MALSIKTDEADSLARELAGLTRESLTDAVTIALRERLERVQQERRRDLEGRLRRLIDEYQALEVEDARTDDEIVGYDQNGLPA
jgi:antitoxin VapB